MNPKGTDLPMYCAELEVRIDELEAVLEQIAANSCPDGDCRELASNALYGPRPSVSETKKENEDGTRTKTADRQGNTTQTSGSGGPPTRSEGDSAAGGGRASPEARGGRFATITTEAFGGGASEEGGVNRPSEALPSLDPGCDCREKNISCIHWAKQFQKQRPNEAQCTSPVRCGHCGECRKLEGRVPTLEKIKESIDSDVLRADYPQDMVDAELREMGLDPTDVGARGVALVEKLKANRTDKPLLPEWGDDYEDQPIAEDEQIHKAFPTRSGRHDLYAEAMRMVGAKRSKGALVALVTWLLLRTETAQVKEKK